MKIDVLFQGFPGKITRGYMSWSSVVYVETVGHKILFDTGSMVERSELPKRFAEHGLRMDDIDLLVLSHFHHDHIMNFDYFKNARILLHEQEAEWVSQDVEDWPVPKYLFPVLQNSGRLELIQKDEEILPGVSTLLSPGHTPGCMSLVLRDHDMPITVLAGDAVKNISELATGEVAMSWDNAASARTIRKIRQTADVVIPGHDRILRILPGKIAATTSCHETITIPPGTADAESSRDINLTIEPTSLPTKE
ncbi:MAG: MBL fold metallo-hydrolase [Veillonellales bacterium]